MSKTQVSCLYVLTKPGVSLPALVALDGVLHLPVFERLCGAVEFIARVAPPGVSLSLCDDIAELQRIATTIPSCRGMALNPSYDEATEEWRFGFVEKVEPSERKAS